MKKQHLIILLAFAATANCRSSSSYDPSLALSAIEGEYKSISTAIENTEKIITQSPENAIASTELRNMKQNIINMYNTCNDIGQRLNSCQTKLISCEADRVENKADVKSARKFGFYMGGGLIFLLYTLLIFGIKYGRNVLALRG